MIDHNQLFSAILNYSDQSDKEKELCRKYLTRHHLSKKLIKMVGKSIDQEDPHEIFEYKYNCGYKFCFDHYLDNDMNVSDTFDFNIEYNNNIVVSFQNITSDHAIFNN